MVEAEIVVGEQKDKFTFRQPEYFRKVCKRVARLGKNDVAMLASKLRQQFAFFRITGIVAHDDLDTRRRPGTGLGYPGTRQETLPVRPNQDRKLHG
jgi:hypothetical protein